MGCNKYREISYQGGVLKGTHVFLPCEPNFENIAPKLDDYRVLQIPKSMSEVLH